MPTVNEMLVKAHTLAKKQDKNQAPVRSSIPNQTPSPSQAPAPSSPQVSPAPAPDLDSVLPAPDFMQSEIKLMPTPKPQVPVQSKAAVSPTMENQQQFYDSHEPGIINQEEAHHYLNLMLAHYKHQPHPALSLAYNTLGTVYHRLGVAKNNASLLQKALTYYKKAFAIDLLIAGDNLSNSHTASITCNYLGMVCCDLGYLDDALKHFITALDIKAAVSDQLHQKDIYIADSLNNLARVYAKLGDHQKTIECYEAALMIIDDYYGDEPTKLLADTYHQLACYHESKKDMVFAKTFYDQELFICQKLGLQERIRKIQGCLYSLAFTEAENEYMKECEQRQRVAAVDPQEPIGVMGVILDSGLLPIIIDQSGKPSVQGVFGLYSKQPQLVTNNLVDRVPALSGNNVTFR